MAACRTAIDALREADVIVLLSTGRPSSTSERSGTVDVPSATRLLSPGTPLRASGLTRSDRRLQPVLALPIGKGADDHPAQVLDPAVGTVVGASLLAGSAVDVPVTALEIVGSGAAAAAALPEVMADHLRTGVLVIADGAACHGDAAPGRRNVAAGPFDRAVAKALAAGDPDALATVCSGVGKARALLATVEPLAALAALTRSRAPDRARVLYAEAPFGVGYLVSQWRWS